MVVDTFVSWEERRKKEEEERKEEGVLRNVLQRMTSNIWPIIA
jgi:hypothetical protein